MCRVEKYAEGTRLCDDVKLDSSAGSGQINSRNPRAHSTQQIGSDSADASGHEICRQHVFTIGSVNGGHIAESHALYIGNVDHGHIHRDYTDDRREHATHEHIAGVAKRAMNTIAITGGD